MINLLSIIKEKKNYLLKYKELIMNEKKEKCNPTLGWSSTGAKCGSGGASDTVSKGLIWVLGPFVGFIWPKEKKIMCQVLIFWKI